MSVAKKIGVAVGVLAVLGIGVTLALPGQSHVERSMMIKAPPEVIHATVGDLKTWDDWTAWTTVKDKTMKREFGASSTGVGGEMRWKGEAMGEGRVVLTKDDRATGITYDISFDGMAPSVGSVSYAPTPEGTKVTWSSDLDLGFNPVMRLMGTQMDGWIGPDFEEGLKNLRLRAEGEARQVEEVKKAEEKARQAAAAAAAAAEAAAAAAQAAAAAAAAAGAAGGQ